jgi:hypothetical protein
MLDAMNDEGAQPNSDTLRESVGDPSLAPVRRRGESQMLALISAGILILIAVAIAKPWGQSVPPPASAPAELARPSTGSAPPPSAWPTVDVETSQPVMIIFLPVEDPSASPGSCTSYQLTPTSANGQYDITADPSGVPYIGGGFAMDANGNTVVEVTCGAGWQPLEPSSPQPTGS